MNFYENLLIIPKFNENVNMAKVEQMIQIYTTNKDYFNFLTNPLQIVKINNKLSIHSLYFLIDGKHRFYMYKKLFEKSNIDGLILINIITCNSIDEMYQIYKKLIKKNGLMSFYIDGNIDESIDKTNLFTYSFIKNFYSLFN